MFCANCGKKLAEDAKFCSECGAKVQIPAPQAKIHVEQQAQNVTDGGAQAGTVQAGTSIIGGKNTIIVNPSPPEKPASRSGPKKKRPPSAQPVSSPQPSTSPDELRSAYLGSIIADCQRARLAALDPQQADPARGAFSLDHLYVSLDTRTQVRVEDEKKKKKQDASPLEMEKTRPLPALEALWTAGERRMVLLGLPGSGKSTLVRYLALRHAQALPDPALELGQLLPGWGGGALLPVIVPLGRLAESLPAGVKQGRAGHVLDFLSETLRADPGLAPYAAHLAADLEGIGGLFLFDGLDEVADLALRPTVVQAVEDFARRFGRHPAARCLVTCRTFSYTDPRWQLAGWTTHELAPFDRGKIDQFVDAWHAELSRVDPARSLDYASKQERLHAALRPGDRRKLAEIASNPLILTVMAVVHTNKGELPDTRAQVYEECIDLLLLRWEAERPVLGGKPQKRTLLDALQIHDIQLKNALQEIAYKAHASQAEGEGEEGQESAALVTEDLLAGVLHTQFRDAGKVQTFLDYCENANGLLLKQGVAPLRGAPPETPPCAVYAFPHLTFQEYLAGRYLRRKPNLDREVRSHLDRSDRWREVIMLLGEHVCFQEGDQVPMDAIINRLAPQPLPEKMGAADWRAMWMAGDLLTLYCRVLGCSDAEGRVRQGLAALLQAGALTPRERAAAGDTLAALGDPRFDAARWHLPAEACLGFVRIPAGKFRMGSDPKQDRNARKEEQPQHEVNLEEYYLGRYPVTVAQFAAFVKDGGYARERYWPEAKAAGVWKNGAVKGRFDQEPRCAPEDFGQPYNLPNHPVVGVTWYEALAYCRWLGEQLTAYSRRQLAEVELAEAEREFWEGLASGRLRVRLPGEAEWEKAARGALPSARVGRGVGGEGSIYPWGDEFDPDKANTVETGIGTTSAVGCFPGGASPYGLLDMSGNAWEWTCSVKGDYPYDPGDGREDLQRDGPRVVRGGAFNGDDGHARCACRVRDLPYLHLSYVGFRAGVSLLPLGAGDSGALGL